MKTKCFFTNALTSSFTINQILRASSVVSIFIEIASMFSSYFYFSYLNVTAFASLLANSVSNARPNAISRCHLLEDF